VTRAGTRARARWPLTICHTRSPTGDSAWSRGRARIAVSPMSRVRVQRAPGLCRCHLARGAIEQTRAWTTFEFDDGAADDRLPRPDGLAHAAGTTCPGRGPEDTPPAQGDIHERKS